MISEIATRRAKKSSSFSKRIARFYLARPILRKNTGTHVAMKRRVRPIADAADEAMLHRVDVTIFDVASEVCLIADQVFPEAALPDAAFVASRPDGAESFSFR